MATDRERARAGQSYRPSNGTEGEMFAGLWCEDCRRAGDDGDINCPIYIAAFANEIGDPGYPAEWRYTAAGQPECTGFAAAGDAGDG